MGGTVHVGIVTYNSLDDLPGCLEGLRAQTYTPMTVTVLDNASSDGGVAWLRDNAPEVTVIESEQNLGYGRGHNTIIDACGLADDDDYLALNPDAHLEPDYIANLVAGMAAHGAGWGIGQLRLTGDDGQPTNLIYSTGHGLLADGYAFNLHYRLPLSSAPHESVPVFGAPGAASLYRGAFIRAISVEAAFFDPHLFLYYEDVDVDWRGQMAGWGCIHEPGAVAWHRGSQPRGDLKMQSLANRYGVAVKNATPLVLWTNHLPRLALHLAARLVLSPRAGVAFARYLRRTLPQMWRQRALMQQASVREWVAWSAQQPTGQPRSLGQRWRSFRQRG